MDPIDTQGTPPSNSADPAAAAPAPAPAPEPAPASEGDDLLAALDEGLTAASPEADPAAAPAPAAATDAPATGDGKDPAAAATDPAATDPAAEIPGAAKPEGKADTPAAKVEPTAEEKAIEQEITDRGLKGDTATRFRELANQVREMAPFKEAAEKAGIKDLGDLPKLVEQAGFGRELYAQVQEAGVSAEQYGMLLDYGGAINRALNGDAKAAEQCWTMMQQEMAAVARLLGREVPGVHDPLADHPDLQAKVAGGTLERADALETARLRTQQHLGEQRRLAETSTQRQQSEQAEARRKGIDDLNALGAEMTGLDPHYAAKAPVLLQQLRAVTSRLPPSEWGAAARELYRTIPDPAPVAAAPAPAPAPAPAARRPAPGPMRGSALRQPMVVETDDPMQAMEQGFEAASR